MPIVAFVSDDGERNIRKKGDREYKTVTTEKTFRYALINQGFNVDTLALSTQNIPDDVKALVIADPQRELSAIAIQKIQAYVAKGGNLLIAGEPGRQQMLNPLLKTLGVQLTSGMLAQESEDYAPMLVLPHLTKAAVGLSKLLDKPSVDTLPVSMNGVSPLSYEQNNGFHVEPLLMTKAGLVRNTMKHNPDLDLVNSKDEAIAGTNGAVRVMSVGGGGGGFATTVSLGNGNIKLGAKKTLKPMTNKNASNETFATALALTRKINGKEQRIFVSGDADFLSNSELGRNTPKTINFYFSTAIFSWLDYGQFPVNTIRPDAKDNRVTVSTAHVSFLKIVYVYILPGLILVFGATFLIRRKRK